MTRQESGACDRRRVHTARLQCIVATPESLPKIKHATTETQHTRRLCLDTSSQQPRLHGSMLNMKVRSAVTPPGSPSPKPSSRLLRRRAFHLQRDLAVVDEVEVPVDLPFGVDRRTPLKRQNRTTRSVEEEQEEKRMYKCAETDVRTHAREPRFLLERRGRRECVGNGGGLVDTSGQERTTPKTTFCVQVKRTGGIEAS